MCQLEVNLCIVLCICRGSVNTSYNQSCGALCDNKWANRIDQSSTFIKLAYFHLSYAELTTLV